MKYRIILYLLSVLAYGFSLYFADKAPENAQNLFDFWLLLFAFIVLDAAYQVRYALYVLFPIGYLVGLLLQFIDAGEGMVYQGIGAWLHFFLGAWLVYRIFTGDKPFPYAKNVALITGLACLVFGLNGFQFLFGLESLSGFLQFRLSSYLLIAGTGQFLLDSRQSNQNPQLVPLFRLILIIHVYLLVGKVITNLL